MTDYCVGVVLVFVEEVLSSRKGDLIDIFVNVVGCHAYTVIADCERSGIFVNLHIHFQIVGFSAEFAHRSQCLELLCGIYGI